MDSLLRSILAVLLLATAALFALAPRPAHAFCINCDDVKVIEYVNEINGHYLLLPASDPEVAIVESGGAGPGWQRTGNDFTTATFEPLPVCRFYSPVFNTHFYTAEAAECALVKANPDWVYEKSPFTASEPIGGGCIGVPVYRVYHAGDHRYTADAGLRDAMIARGWKDEGVGFCVRTGGREALVTANTLNTFPVRIDSPQACQSTMGACIALDSLAPMPNRVPPYLPPNYITTNPAYPTGVSAIVGTENRNDLYTGEPPDPAAILQHSFATVGPGLYINGHDRLDGDYARITPMVELPGVAGPTSDERLFVWRTATDRELRVSALASVGIVARDGPGSQAYGGPVLEFGDAASGRSFLVTLQAYGIMQPADFVAPDARSAEPIVSTVFRPNPLFGRVLSGSFIACTGDGSPCAPASGSFFGMPFSFSLKRADFQAALDRARSVDPALSGNPADYFLARVAFNNETYLDARLGASVAGLTAEIWYVE
jgi:hypothetical protein